MMRTEFDSKLNHLCQLVKDLASLDTQSFEAVKRFLADRDRAALAATRHTGARAKELYREADRQSLMLILRQQPVAGDLRTIALMQGVSLDLARIGGQIRELAKLLKAADPAAASGLLAAMASQSSGMVQTAVEAVFTRSLDLARQVIASDDETDRMFEAIRTQLEAGAGTMEDSVNLLMAAKYLERIADHAAAMAEKLIRIEDPDA